MRWQARITRLKCPQKTVAKANMCKVVYDDYYWGLVKCFSAKTRIADSPAPKCASHQNVCREQTVCIAQCVRLIKERQRNILCMIVRVGCMHFMTARLFWLFKLQSKGSVTNDHRSLAVNVVKIDAFIQIYMLYGILLHICTYGSECWRSHTFFTSHSQADWRFWIKLII